MTTISPLAGKPAPPSMLVNVSRLVTAYYAEHPDPSVAAERVAFGTSGHRGSAFGRSFNEAHIVAITQAICSYRHLRTPQQRQQRRRRRRRLHPVRRGERLTVVRVREVHREPAVAAGESGRSVRRSHARLDDRQRRQGAHDHCVGRPAEAVSEDDRAHRLRPESRGVDLRVRARI